MRLLTTLLLSAATLAALGCSTGSKSDVAHGVADQTTAPASEPAAPATARGTIATNAADAPAGGTAGRTTSDGRPDFKTVSLAQGDPSAAVARKIIRNATLTVETERPSEGMRKVASLAEARGGFVVTSETRTATAADSVTPYEVVTVDVRVPAAQFDAFVGEVRGTGSRVVGEKITGQDVTEEFIDLEARLRTQRALEAQFLEIMKQARAVSDALEVQSELANVRSEIERHEGRRRFLENQTSLSTVKVTLQPPAPLINASGFGHGLREAFSDGLDAAATVTLGLVRVALALIPIAIFVGFPLFLLTRFFLRRLRRRVRPAEQLQ
jgi:hypothetical protein